MGSSRYSPEGLQAEEFPLDIRYRIDALYKLALSAFNAGNYEDTVHFVKKALEKSPSDLEILTLIDKVKLKDPKMDLSFFDKFNELKKRTAEASATPDPKTAEAPIPPSVPVAKIALPQDQNGPPVMSAQKPATQPAKESSPARPQPPLPSSKLPENVPLGFLTDRQANLNPLSVNESPVPLYKVKGPIPTKVPVTPKEEHSTPTKVLKPAQKAPEPQKPAFNNPEISDLFNFDDIHPKESAPPKEPSKKAEPPQTSAGRRAKATEEVIKKLLSKKSLTEERSELYKQVKRQLDEFKEEGYVVSRIEQMMVNKNPDMRKVLDDLVIISAQIDELRELKGLLDEAARLPDVNKAKVFSIKLKLSDPDRVKEIKMELDQLLTAASPGKKPDRTISPESQTNIKNLLELGRTALKQGNNQSALRFFTSILEIDPTNLDTQQELERLRSARPVGDEKALLP